MRPDTPSTPTENQWNAEQSPEYQAPENLTPLSQINSPASAMSTPTSRPRSARVLRQNISPLVRLPFDDDPSDPEDDDSEPEDDSRSSSPLSDEDDVQPRYHAIPPTLYEEGDARLYLPVGRTLNYRQWTTRDVRNWASNFIRTVNNPRTLGIIEEQQLDGRSLELFLNNPELGRQLRIPYGHMFHLRRHAAVVINSRNQAEYDEDLRWLANLYGNQ